MKTTKFLKTAEIEKNSAESIAPITRHILIVAIMLSSSMPIRFTSQAINALIKFIIVTPVMLAD